MAGHWYSAEGYLYGQVPMSSKEGYRDFTLADARKVGGLPSVTSILSLLAKPGLVRWQVEQGIKAALDTAIMEPEATGVLLAIDEQGLYKDLAHKAEEYTRWTQDFGTATHWWLNKKLRAVETLEIPPMIPGAEECADGILAWFESNGYEFSHTEHRFARTDLGYAGTIDLIGTHNGVPCIVDLKTQEPPLTPYLEHALQLAGYDYALEPATTPCMCDICDAREIAGVQRHEWQTIPRERISLIANRLNPGEVHQHLWVDKGSTVEQTNNRYNQMFLLLRDFWFLSNGYDPRTT